MEESKFDFIRTFNTKNKSGKADEKYEEIVAYLDKYLEDLNSETDTDAINDLMLQTGKSTIRKLDNQDLGHNLIGLLVWYKFIDVFADSLDERRSGISQNSRKRLLSAVESLKETFECPDETGILSGFSSRSLETADYRTLIDQLS
jgi:hypothetical protein